MLIMRNYISVGICLLIFLISIQFALANNNKNINCKNAYTTQQLNYCAEQALNNAKFKLDKVYADSLAVAAQIDKGSSSTENITKSLMATQQGWQNYMNFHCNNVLVVYQGGSEATMQFLACKKDMMEERIKLLTRLYVSR